MDRPNVYDYREYRSYMVDLFRYCKDKTPCFSYRLFSRKAGFSSPNFLKRVIDGQRNLTNESVAKVARGFGLKKHEREFLENLVFMNQADDHEEKNHYYKRMMAVSGFVRVHKLEKAQYEYFSKWYYPAVREIAVLKGGTHTPEEIAATLDPPISHGEATKALEVLVQLGMIRKDADEHWVQCEQAITTGPEVESLIVANYHREMLRLSTESMERHSADERDLTALTISVSKSRTQEIKDELASLRRKLLEFACSEHNGDEVIQINIQMFPLTNGRLEE